MCLGPTLRRGMLVILAPKEPREEPADQESVDSQARRERLAMPAPLGHPGLRAPRERGACMAPRESRAT